MFARLLLGLFAMALMARPRSTPGPVPPTGPPPTDGPPSRPDIPKHDDGIEPDLRTLPTQPRSPKDPRPDFPPMGPPGHDGEWPPRKRGPIPMPELPPTRDYPPDRGFPDTPPPGYDGEWPPRKPAPIPAPEMPEPDYPPTGPPGYTGEWPPPHRPLHDLIRILETYDLGSIIHDPTEAQYGYESGSYMSGDITSEN